MANLNEFILCAAVLYNGTIVSGYRHGDCNEVISALTGLSNDKLPGREAQGFLTSKKRFVYRKEAYAIAKENNQLILSPLDDPNATLSSEDLYYYMDGDDIK